ncbi:ATP phosphoribosyltransferase [Candidatus Bathyarchaeota archaeon]|nr:ATP phosphoribosyltransferase [Candidatus Bathyarchaeota archaeon]
MTKVKFLIPKGSLEENTYQLLNEAGYIISGQERTYRPTINDPKILLKILRPQEIPIFVEEGLHDVGITGQDWVKETGVDVQTLMNLEYGKVKLLLAIPEQWTHINSLSQLLRNFSDDNKNVRITTEYLNTTVKYITTNSTYIELYGDTQPLVITPWWRKGENSKVSVFLSFGATEAKPPENADAIVDIAETGTTIEQNNLKPIECLYESQAVLIVNKDALKNPSKREKIYDILTLLKGVIDGRKKIHIFVNVKEENLNQIIEKLPSLKGPTISPLSTKGWYSINAVIDRKDFHELLPTLRKLAQGLVVHEPRQILSLEEIAGEENGSETYSKN